MAFSGYSVADSEARRREPPSAHEKEAYMRDQMDEDELKKVIKHYPQTRQAALGGL